MSRLDSLFKDWTTNNLWKLLLIMKSFLLQFHVQDVLCFLNKTNYFCAIQRIYILFSISIFKNLSSLRIIFNL